MESKTPRIARTEYPLALNVRYRGTYESVITVGTGRTVSMSSKQVLFRTDRPFEPGSPIELSIEWPVSLDDNTRLQLNIQGDIIRSRGIWTLVTVLKHEFRTRGMRSVAHPAGHAESPYTARRQSELLQVAGAAH